MDAQSLKRQLSENDLLSILSDLGAEPYLEGSKIICRTICHNGCNHGKHKLEYYIETGLMHCYTDLCGTMDLFSLIQKVKGIEFNKAFEFVKEYFGIKTEITEYYDSVDISFFNKFNKEKETRELAKIDERILNIYEDIYHMSWVKEGILPSTMRKFGVKMSIGNQQIIIPHYDINNRLVGIRARNLDPYLVDKGLKYIPVKTGGITYSHPTGANLYGLDINIDNIKRMRKIILFESEKSVLQLDSIYNGYGIGVGVSGSSFTDKQLDLIQALDVDEVIIAFDKEFHEIGDSLEKYYAKKIETTVANKLLPYFSVSVIWDLENDLEIKDAPTDKGTSVFKKLFSNRISLI